MNHLLFTGLSSGNNVNKVTSALQTLNLLEQRLTATRSTTQAKLKLNAETKIEQSKFDKENLSVQEQIITAVLHYTQMENVSVYLSLLEGRFVKLFLDVDVDNLPMSSSSKHVLQVTLRVIKFYYYEFIWLDHCSGPDRILQMRTLLENIPNIVANLSMEKKCSEQHSLVMNQLNWKIPPEYQLQPFSIDEKSEIQKAINKFIATLSVIEEYVFLKLVKKLFLEFVSKALKNKHLLSRVQKQILKFTRFKEPNVTLSEDLKMFIKKLLIKPLVLPMVEMNRDPKNPFEPEEKQYLKHCAAIKRLEAKLDNLMSTWFQHMNITCLGRASLNKKKKRINHIHSIRVKGVTELPITINVDLENIIPNQSVPQYLEELGREEMLKWNRILISKGFTGSAIGIVANHTPVESRQFDFKIYFFKEGLYQKHVRVKVDAENTLKSYLLSMCEHIAALSSSKTTATTDKIDFLYLINLRPPKYQDSWLKPTVMSHLLTVHNTPDKRKQVEQ